jgi:hypothetical protein
MGETEMTENEKLRLITETIEAVDKFRHASKTARAVMGYSLESEFGKSVESVVDLLISTTSTAVGDVGEWVSWFINDAPADDPTVWIDNNDYVVRNASDLLTVINEFRRSIG